MSPSPTPPLLLVFVLTSLHVKPPDPLPKQTRFR
jgi:hypothetical protein